MQALVGAWRTTSLVTSLTYVPKAYTPNVESIFSSSAIYPDFPFQRLPGSTASWLEELIWSTRNHSGFPWKWSIQRHLNASKYWHKSINTDAIHLINLSQAYLH